MVMVKEEETHLGQVTGSSLKIAPFFPDGFPQSWKSLGNVVLETSGKVMENLSVWKVDGIQDHAGITVDWPLLITE